MQHLEEGTIHAWIDGALSPEESREVEAHIATCEACSQLAAEARGLVAASSRILMSLDDVPGDVIPIVAPSAVPATERSDVTPIHAATKRSRFTPFWMRTAAAVVIIAGTSALVMTAKLNNPETKGAVALMLDSMSAESAPKAADLSSPLPAAAPDAFERSPQAPTPQATSSAAGSRAPRAATGNVATTAPREERASIAAASVRSSTGDARTGRPGSRSEVASADAAADRSLGYASGTVVDTTSSATKETQTSQLLDNQAKLAQERDLALQRSTATAPASRPPSSPSLHADTGGLAHQPSGLGVVGSAAGAIADKMRAARKSAPSAPAAVSPGSAMAGRVLGMPTEMLTARGCYALTMSPWSGTTIPFGAPPPKIELDTIRSETGDLLVHPGRGAASNGARRAFWTQQGDSVYITWENDARGVRLTLPAYGEVLRGRAETISATGDGTRQTSTVEARRISCRE